MKLEIPVSDSKFVDELAGSGIALRATRLRTTLHSSRRNEVAGLGIEVRGVLLTRLRSCEGIRTRVGGIKFEVVESDSKFAKVAPELVKL